MSQSTVAKYMHRHPRPPSQTWRTFLANHASQIMAADLVVVPKVTFRLLYMLVILAHERRRIVHLAVTDHPTAAWTAQQLRDAFPENEAPRDDHAAVPLNSSCCGGGAEDVRPPSSAQPRQKLKRAPSCAVRGDMDVRRRPKSGDVMFVFGLL